MSEKKHDLDLGDGHYLDWTTYEGERCGGIISHTKDQALYESQMAKLKESGNYDEEVAEFYRLCQGAITIKGSTSAIKHARQAVWEMTGTFEQPTFSPSFLCHCGDHGFVREGKWVRA
jgi:hypothetical protein